MIMITFPGRSGLEVREKRGGGEKEKTKNGVVKG